MSDQAEPSRLLGRGNQERNLLTSIFAIDARSLALLRILIAIIVLWNCLNIFGSLDVFYSESGVLPAKYSQYVVAQSGPGAWSVLWLNESENWATAWLLVNVVAAVGLLIGYQTFFCTLVCLVLAWSFQMRNPLVLTAGDILLRMTLFWGMFLPWGGYWSLDCRKYVDIRPAKWKVLSCGTAAIMLQLAAVYFFSGIAKANGSWDGTAIVNTLNLEMYCRPLGLWMGQFEGWLGWLSPWILILEIVGPLLLFVPPFHQYWRGTMMALMWIMHLTIWLTMSIGIFSAVAIVCWVVFIPSEVWNGVVGRPEGFEKDQVDELVTLKRGWQIMGLVALLIMLWVNLDQINQPKNSTMIGRISNVLMIRQEFKMFANPPSHSPWPTYPAKLISGSDADLFSADGKALADKPKSVFEYMRSQQWRRYHFNLIDVVERQDTEAPAIYQKLRDRLLRVFVERWNAKYPKGEAVNNAKLIMNFEPLKSPDNSAEAFSETWAEFN